jgi:hypothetical protein
MVDTSMHFCPHTDCDYRGWLGLHNLRANSHPSSGPWRQFHCLGCNGYFPEHHGTIFHGKQAAVERIVRVLACLAEGLGIRATARVFEVAPNTVLRRGCNPRLRHALYHMARVAMQRDAPVNRVYAAWRAKGQRHGQALRNMATDCCVF